MLLYGLLAVATICGFLGLGTISIGFLIAVLLTANEKSEAIDPSHSQ